MVLLGPSVRVAPDGKKIRALNNIWEWFVRKQNRIVVTKISCSLQWTFCNFLFFVSKLYPRLFVGRALTIILTPRSTIWIWICAFTSNFCTDWIKISIILGKSSFDWWSATSHRLIFLSKPRLLPSHLSHIALPIISQLPWDAEQHLEEHIQMKSFTQQ